MFALYKYINFQKPNNLTRYSQILFDGDLIEMRGGLSLTPDGQAARAVATPFKKYSNAGDYIYCPTGSNCKIYIEDQKMMELVSHRGYINLWVS